MNNREDRAYSSEPPLPARPYLMSRIERDIQRAWDQEQLRIEDATPRIIFELGFCQGRISGGAEVGSRMIAAAEKAEKNGQDDREGVCIHCGREEYHDISGIALQVNPCRVCDRPICSDCGNIDYDQTEDSYVCVTWQCTPKCQEAA